MKTAVYKLLSQDIEALEKRTLNDSQVWLKERRLRITSSRMGSIFKRRKEINSKFIDRIREVKPFSCAAIRYGNFMEPHAREAFIEKTGIKVRTCGLFIGEAEPWLGGTPDGITEHGDIIEIKCPYTHRDLEPQNIPAINPNFFCRALRGGLVLKRNHDYYIQIQANMYFAKAKKTYFIVYTPRGISIEIIARDDQLIEKLLAKCTDFYMAHISPYILSSVDNKPDCA
jgi:predicted phage-related endonuclease